MIDHKPELSTDTGELALVYKKYGKADIEARKDGTAPTEQMTQYRLVGEFLEEFAKALHDQDTKTAAVIAHNIERAVGELPTLDAALWPVVLETFQKSAGVELPPSESILVERDPRQTLASLFGNDPKRIKTVSRKSFMASLRGLANNPIIKPLLFALALQGACREMESKTTLPATAAVGASAPSPGALPVDALIESFADEAAAPSRDKLFETLTSTNTFTRDRVFAMISNSIREQGASWGMAADLPEPEVHETVKLAQGRVWGMIKILSDNHDEADEIKFTDRKVRGRSAKEELGKIHLFSADEQKEYLQSWLQSNRARLTAPDSSHFVNLSSFQRDQPDVPRALASTIDHLVPWGVLVLSSGQRNQTEAIWNYAKAQNISTAGLQPDSREDTIKLQQALVKAGMMINAPGQSKHEVGLAVDMVVQPELWKLYADVAADIQAHLSEDRKKLGIPLQAIIEHQNGNHGVIHFETTPAGGKKIVQKS